MTDEDNSLDGSLLAMYEESAHLIQHPALRFLGDGEDRDDDEEEVTEDRLVAERRLRGAVMVAAIQIIDRCIEDMAEWQDHERVEQDREEALGTTFVWEYFPPRFRAAYNGRFYADALVSAVKVAYDLANPAADRPACIAEEMITNAICIEAEAMMSEVGVDTGWGLEDLLLEDMDFEALFSKSMDGFEDDPAAQRAGGMWVPSVAEWFAPFNSDRIVHPYAATERSDPLEYDLSHLAQTDEAYAMTDDATLVDDPAPISGMAAVSEIVELARRATTLDPLVWIPDPNNSETSYTALLPLASAAPSGWLEWEPHKGAGVIRKDPVIAFDPHRHYPLGVDQPWVATSVMGGVIMHVPLAAVVSYRPDPTVHERWSTMFNFGADNED